MRRSAAALAVAAALLASSDAAAPVRSPRAGTTPQCFGALARDPLVPCRNPQLRLLVTPTPTEARDPRNRAVCPKIGYLLGKRVCSFGVEPSKARRVVALVGDSHAGMWHLALDSTARALGWTGVHLGHASCPLSAALRDLPEPNRSHCARWKREVFAWFAQHPEVSALFVSELSSGKGVVASRGRSEFETSVAGYQAAWQALPATVQHIVVIRDTPKRLSTTAACIEQAMSRSIPAGIACAVPRAVALPPDPAAVAARRLRRPRVQLVDLTPIFCGFHVCLPVIGGALVHKDTTHLTPAFGQSLGEPLLRRVRALSQAWP